jgi:hypothetical protein
MAEIELVNKGGAIKIVTYYTEFSIPIIIFIKKKVFGLD